MQVRFNNDIIIFFFSFLYVFRFNCRWTKYIKLTTSVNECEPPQMNNPKFALKRKNIEQLFNWLSSPTALV